MRLSVSEMARLCGVSVRTLHYYDEIGLLCPETAAESGYRWYGAGEIETMQQILFFRELDFPLKEISTILSDPHYDRQAVLEKQKELLTMKRDRLNGLICLLEENLKGVDQMRFEAFDQSEIEAHRHAYAREVKSRWGGTDAYRESAEREVKKTGADRAAELEEMNAIFHRAAQLRQSSPESPEAQTLVQAWKDHISAHHYTCTDEILAGLGQMYTADERFRKNLDRFGKGTAEFLSKAIAVYCVE